VTHLITAANTGSRGQLVVHDVENIGPHYARALRLWREQFTACYARGELNVTKYDEEFWRRWVFYLAFCETGFKYRVLGDVQITFSRVGDMDYRVGVPE
jgi:cyclopropane-fatty-acyl-phospholipid synthase